MVCDLSAADSVCQILNMLKEPVLYSFLLVQVVMIQP